MKSRVPLLFGSSAFGIKGTLGTRIHDINECRRIVEYLNSKGYHEYDGARKYGDGSSEEYLGKLRDLGALEGAKIDTKVFVAIPGVPGDHAPGKLRASLQESLKALNMDKVRVFYLHLPDRGTPFEDTLFEINELYKEGKFEYFGLSNYYSWEVAEIVTIAKAKGWIAPTVYQGVYNALERNIESELIPCLRKFGLSFVAYSPLARGLFGGVDPNAPAKGSRWDFSSSVMAPGLHMRYKGYTEIFPQLTETLKRHNLSGAEVALRWLQHHSALGQEDGIILGASSLEQLQANVEDSEKDPLPSAIVDLLQEMWVVNKGRSPPYFIVPGVGGGKK
ncbi:Aldo keto reductase [Coniophora puteana RWD-64-598 SS2]|uniref:Aldo keto reductase n=1 Tax=Coniophora puteana (strain RWD-64-598) TaxID=741705 RepID=A0A5M3MI94_CONPW|nr:Aldo keto reductase [Coniophora puteana RWD-64-598 SS2]EIW78932.1 Aldo keto reductase [Coniophora puteana RWD-64-598 SS2]